MAAFLISFASDHPEVTLLASNTDEFECDVLIDGATPGIELNGVTAPTPIPAKVGESGELLGEGEFLLFLLLKRALERKPPPPLELVIVFGEEPPELLEIENPDVTLAENVEVFGDAAGEDADCG